MTWRPTHELRSLGLVVAELKGRRVKGRTPQGFTYGDVDDLELEAYGARLLRELERQGWTVTRG